MGRNISKLDYMGKETRVDENDFWFNWCCDCSLRHIYYFKVEHDEKGNHVIVMSVARDDMCTDLRKAYIRRRKRGKSS